ncbi:MAG: zinc ribbon domain-containing protein [Anaerolineae bacterium]
MKNTNWMPILILGLIALLVLAGGLGLLTLAFGRYQGMGPGMMGQRPGSWGGWCGGIARFGSGRGMGWLGWLFTPLFMLVGWLIPLGLLALLITGGVWLARGLRQSETTASASPAATCPQCGQPVASNWHNCPYCGTELGTAITH